MAIEYVPYNLTDEQVRELWDRYSRGETAAALGRRFGKSANSMSERIRQAGGIRPTMPTRAARHLTLEDREEISRGLAADHSLRQIADRLGRSPSTTSREVNNNGGRGRYRASTAERAAIERRKRPKPCKLATSPWLAGMVELLSNVVDGVVRDVQAARTSSVSWWCWLLLSCSCPSMKVAPARMRGTSSGARMRRQRCWAASSSL
jgi:DNA-binding CsgD family transcriptional regulator